LQFSKDPFPDSFAGPAIKAFPNRVPLAETFRKIAPRNSGLGNPQNSINEEPIVLGRHPRIAFLAGQETLDALPMFIRNSMATKHGGPSLVVKTGPPFTAIAQLLSIRPSDLCNT
jgi:hypothetical protein